MPGKPRQNHQKGHLCAEASRRRLKLSAASTLPRERRGICLVETKSSPACHFSKRWCFVQACRGLKQSPRRGKNQCQPKQTGGILKVGGFRELAKSTPAWKSGQRMSDLQARGPTEKKQRKKKNKNARVITQVSPKTDSLVGWIWKCIPGSCRG